MKQPATTFLGKPLLTKSVSGCVLALTGYAADGSFEEWHTHEHASISFLLNGTHEEDLSGRKYKRVPGDIKFIPAGEPHRCNHYAPGTRKINLDLSDALLGQMDIQYEQIIHLLNNSPQTKFTLLKLYHELDDTGSHATASAHLLLYELLYVHPKRQYSSAKNPPAWANILRELLHDEWSSKFDLKILAGKAGIHPVSLSRYFPRYFSATLGSYIKQIKVDKALSFIKTTQLSLTEIAYLCGFADQAHFTRTFKEITGYLPKDFRKI